MNAIRIIALIIAVILIVAWCYYRVRLRKAKKEGQKLQAQLKQRGGKECRK